MALCTRNCDGRYQRFLAKGFTLIELIITLAVIAILVCIAIPSYEFALVRSRTVAAQGCVMKDAQYMEQYRTIHMSYSNAPLPDCDEVGVEHYMIAFVGEPTASGFTIKAQPVGRQAQVERRCGAMTINNVGQRTALTSDCW